MPQASWFSLLVSSGVSPPVRSHTLYFGLAAAVLTAFAFSEEPWEALRNVWCLQESAIRLAVRGAENLGDHAIVSIDAFPGRQFNGKVYEISSSALSAGGAGSNQAALAASASDEVTNFLVKVKITAL